MSSRARPKPQLSCDICRQKKLKCDRQRPCSNCTRDSRRVCTYPSEGALGADPNAKSRVQKLPRIEDRISRLEGRLQQLVSGFDKHPDVVPQQPTPAAGDAVTAPELVLNTDGQETYYVDPSHWEGIMFDIAGIKEDLGRRSSSFSSTPAFTPRPGDVPVPQLFFGNVNDINHEDLHNPQLPKETVDSLIDFITDQNFVAGALIVLHIPTFRRELGEYWKSPQDVSLAWLAIFYTVLSLACHTALISGMQVKGMAQLDQTSYLCMVRAGQCLRDSEYLDPSDHTIVAMILYLASEHPFSGAGHFKASVVLGVIVRLALRLGYHRDPSSIRDITVFQGEMRRRIWAMMVQVDHLLAVKAGLPRLIDERKSDTQLPRNLLDEDLDPAMKGLPPSRSLHQPTPAAFLLHKAALVTKMSDIIDSSRDSYDQVRELDKVITAEASSRPHWLRVPDDEASLSSVSLLMLSAIVESNLIEQAARMILHRRFVIPAYSDSRYAFSRQQSLAAAERAIHLQYILTHDWQGQGDIVNKNWRSIALFSHDFLAAAMLLCLDLDQILNHKHDKSHITIDEMYVERRLKLLHQAQGMWKVFGQFDITGQKPANILEVLLERFELARGKAVSPPAISDSFAASQSAFQSSSVLHAPNLDGLQYSFASQNLQSEAMGIAQVGGPDLAYDATIPEMWPNDAMLDNNAMQIQSMLDDSQIDFDWQVWMSSAGPSTGLDFDL